MLYYPCTVTDSPTDRLTDALADRYRIERELGQGGMATVYLAHDVRHDRKVALKVLRPELAAVIGAERFLAEIKTTANLQHPHILPLFDSGLAGTVVFYVMPYVEGESLRDRLTREKQLGIEDAVRMVREAASALDYAHRHGVIHRDIKPENILVHDGQALVADFGIALAVSRSDGGSRMTETGLSLGTPHYMSPEQAMGERTVDARTDIYALGCVLYELLTGEPPFTGPTAQAIVAKVLASDPEPVTTLRRMVPPHVVEAIHTAIQKLPADRFKSAAEFSAALDGRTEGRTDGRRTVPGRGVPSVVPSFRRSVAVAWVLAAIASIAAAAGWLRKPPPAPVTRFSVALPDSQAFVSALNARIAVSPDGRHMVYRGGEAPSRLFLRALERLTAVPLPGTEGAVNPSFSPDGRFIAFTTGNPAVLKVIDLTGTPPTLVTDSAVDHGGVSWGPGGIYYDGHLEGDGIARITGPGSTPEIVSTPVPAQGESWHFQPEALPGGRGIVFTVAYAGLLERMSIAVLDLETRKHRVLGLGMAPRYAVCGHLLYVTADGVLMAVSFDQDRLESTGEPFAVARDISVRELGRADVSVSSSGTLVYASGSISLGQGELSWVSRTGAATPVDTAWRMRFSTLVLSPDGSRLAATVLDGTSRSIWVKDLDRGPAAKFTLERDRNDFPSWSPDGRTIAFLATTGGEPFAVYAGPADGSTTPTLLRKSGLTFTSATIAPDGKRLILQIQGDLFLASTVGDTSLTPLVTTPALEIGGRVSANGRWLAYASDESGRMEVYVRPFPDTRVAKRQVSVNGGSSPRWSRDGREIFFVDGDRNLVAMPVLPGAAFATGKGEVLFGTLPFHGTAPYLSYDPHPDGLRFIMSRQLRAAGRPEEVIVVQNFFEVLKRR